MVRSIITHTTQPVTGLFKITGHDTGHKQTFSEVSQKDLKLVFLAPLLRKFTSGDDEKLLLYSTLLGLSQRSFSKGNYTGSGSLFHIGDRIERRTYHYNTSSVVEGTTDEGLITDPHSTADDLGSVTNAYLPPTIDHGDLVILPGEENPFGLFRIAGGDTGHKQTFAGDFGGSLFTAGSSAEVVGFNPPEETFLFGFSGAAVEKHVENYVGSGFIKYQEDTPLAPNAHVRFRPHMERSFLIIVLKFWVLQIQHSRVLMYPRVSSPECTPMIRVKSGADIAHHLAMSTPSTARSVVLHSSTATAKLARSAYSVTMVMTEILELLVHCSELVVQQNPEVSHLR